MPDESQSEQWNDQTDGSTSGFENQHQPYQSDLIIEWLFIAGSIRQRLTFKPEALKHRLRLDDHVSATGARGDSQKDIDPASNLVVFQLRMHRMLKKAKSHSQQNEQRQRRLRLHEVVVDLAQRKEAKQNAQERHNDLRHLLKRVRRSCRRGCRRTTGFGL